MLRANLSAIHEALTYKSLVVEDFAIEQGEMKDKSHAGSATHGNKWELRIVFRPEPAYTFRAVMEIPSGLEKRLQGYYREEKSEIVAEASPGEFYFTEPLTFDTPAAMVVGIHDWVDRIESELQARPVNRELQRQQQEIEGLIQQFQQMPEQYFTRDEAEDVRARLDALEERLAENIRQNVENERQAEAKIAKLHADIETLKDRLDAFDKAGWAKTFFIRVAKWMSDPINRKVLKSGAEVAQKLLLEAGEQSDIGTPTA